MQMRHTEQQVPQRQQLRQVAVCITGTIIRSGGGGQRLVPLALVVEPPPDGSGAVLPLLDHGLGTELANYLGENLTVRGWLVEAGATQYLSVTSYVVSVDRYRLSASVRGVCRRVA